MRIIGIRHRTKQTKAGEARPTQLHVIPDSGKPFNLELADDNAELDFVRGRFPTKFRPVTIDDDLSKHPAHHIKWRKLETEEAKPTLPDNFFMTAAKVTYVVSKIPCEYDGFKSGDVAAMILGGSGDILAYALSRQAEKIGAQVMRIPPFALKFRRPVASKNDDSILLATLVRDESNLFYIIRPRDQKLILVRERKQCREDAMLARMACEQRLWQRFIGQVFTRDAELGVETSIEKAFDAVKATDKILLALQAEEKAVEKMLVAALDDLDVYKIVFPDIEGMGPMIGSRLISALMDIRRFPTEAALKAFCGVHVMADGRFPRRRNSELANWNPDCRQALYLFIDQAHRRPGSVWGRKYREYKVKMRLAHPYPVLVVPMEGKFKVRVDGDNGCDLINQGTELSTHFAKSEMSYDPCNGKFTLILPNRTTVVSPNGRAEDLYELIENKFTYEKKTGKYTIQTATGEVVVKGTQRYTKAHIYKSAGWKMAGKFVEWLFKEWWKLEGGAPARPRKPHGPAELHHQPSLADVKDDSVIESPDETDANEPVDSDELTDDDQSETEPAGVAVGK